MLDYKSPEIDCSRKSQKNEIAITNEAIKRIKIAFRATRKIFTALTVH